MFTLETYSKFYYDFVIDENNQWVDFDDGSGPQAAKIPAGAYTMTTLGIIIGQQMTSLSVTHTFACVADRDSRVFTISATGGTFDLLFSSGTNVALSVYPAIGFNNADYTAAASYLGALASGAVYYPQYVLQKFVSADYNNYPVSTVVNKSTSGSNYEVVKFGFNNLYRFEIAWTTDINLEENSIIKNNPNGLAELNSFMQYCSNKFPIEIMLDEENAAVFDTITIETTPQSSDGVSYEITPDYSNNVPDFYTLGGMLVFRRIE